METANMMMFITKAEAAEEEKWTCGTPGTLIVTKWSWLCHPDWSGVAQSPLTATSNLHLPAVLPPHPPELTGITGGFLRDVDCTMNCCVNTLEMFDILSMKVLFCHVPSA
ncbi:hypothetical protein AAY473_018872 [Plecturocebus cupreus]